ncbi:hypothetical protein ASD06_06870 [Angustibacter sp. Root456]|nr:hypothetical protein ASD06_06870 [Angustibacter sp. Root456]
MAIATTEVVKMSRDATSSARSAPATNTSLAWAAPLDAVDAALRAAEANTVTSTASPRVEPTCCDTFTRPDAAPASCGRTPCSAAAVSGTNTVPLPTPMKNSGTAIAQ